MDEEQIRYARKALESVVVRFSGPEK